MSAKEDLYSFLKSRVEGEYLDLLPTRWGALLRRIAKATQTLQLHTSCTDGGADCIEDLFVTANTLLDMEHRIYRDGVSHVQRCASVVPLDAMRPLHQLLQEMLMEISVAESVLAHWSSTTSDISADTLRVYCHCIVARSRLSTAQVQKAMNLASSLP